MGKGFLPRAGGISSFFLLTGFIPLKGKAKRSRASEAANLKVSREGGHSGEGSSRN
jgi:hypothetical protein